MQVAQCLAEPARHRAGRFWRRGTLGDGGTGRADPRLAPGPASRRRPGPYLDPVIHNRSRLNEEDEAGLAVWLGRPGAAPGSCNRTPMPRHTRWPAPDALKLGRREQRTNRGLPA